MEKIFFYETAIGRIAIAEKGGAVTRLYLTEDGLAKGEQMEETPLLAKAAAELKEYLAGSRKTFDLPLAPEGSDFYQKVWSALQAIPYGKTASYGQVARAVGKPGGARAVGRANHENPIMIMIPCHRVIGANGEMVGFGAGLPLKERLLLLEKDNGEMNTLPGEV